MLTARRSRSARTRSAPQQLHPTAASGAAVRPVAAGTDFSEIERLALIGR
ncbi:hypothetical protein YT1_5027 [Rhodococcus ruber]|nr:hypothetical protein YT1_5027 [Rhodococcus ruber]